MTHSPSPALCGGLQLEEEKGRQGQPTTHDSSQGATVILLPQVAHMRSIGMFNFFFFFILFLLFFFFTDPSWVLLKCQEQAHVKGAREGILVMQAMSVQGGADLMSDPASPLGQNTLGSQ